MSRNQLTGSIPRDLIFPQGFKTLSLYTNKLSGALDPAWDWPPLLQDLALHDNRFKGTIPRNWTLPDSLQLLALASNSFTGTIPADWALPDSLHTLDLRENRLGGTISPAWKLSSLLQALALSSNLLTGTISGEWVLPPTLQTLDLSNNKLGGTIPAYWNLSSELQIPSSPPYYTEDPNIPNTYVQLTQSSFGSCPEGTPERYTYNPAASPEPSPSPSPLPSVNPTSPISQESPGTTGGGNSAVGIAVGVAVGVAALGVEGKQEWFDSEGKDDPEFGPLKSKLSADIHSARDARKPPPDQQDPELTVALREKHQDGSSMAAALQRPSLEATALRMWIIDFKALELQRQIGEGSYGRVYVASWQCTPVAVKILLNTAVDMYSEEAVQQAITLSNPVLENLQKEAALMCSLRHPNIVTFLGVCPFPPCVVTEYCSRGSLSDVLRSAKTSASLAAKLDWNRRLSLMLDTAKGMLHLHAHNPPIIHRDLKSPNLLVDAHWHCKVSDFNLSRILEDRVGLSGNSSHAGATNPRWLAPEVLEGHPASLKSDVYSFGVVLWEVLTWEVPFAGHPHFQLIKHVAAGGRPPLPARQELPGMEGGEPGGLDGLIELMERCWAQAPEQRPTFQDVFNTIRHILKEAALHRRSAVKPTVGDI
ncbi:hypothetical protein N2152v2_008055 [Parachlorella kessleri]